MRKIDFSRQWSPLEPTLSLLKINLWIGNVKGSPTVEGMETKIVLVKSAEV